MLGLAHFRLVSLSFVTSNRNLPRFLVPLLHELDALNQSIKARFVYSDDFEFLDESLFDAARKSIGDQGFDVMLRYLDHLPADIIKRRLLDMTGLDGSEEMLLIDPSKMTDVTWFMR